MGSVAAWIGARWKIKVATCARLVLQQLDPHGLLLRRVCLFLVKYVMSPAFRVSFMLDVSATIRKKQLCVYFTAGEAGQDSSGKEDAPAPLHASSNMLLREFYKDLKGLAGM